jgi:molecular chaperone DnaK (HSP70)
MIPIERRNNMERIIKAIEAKLKEQEDIIAIQTWEIDNFKRKLEEAEKTIEEQAQVISDLKGENA